MPVDEAALHAAIIAVNEALDHDAEDNAARALKNPAACLADINQVRFKAALSRQGVKTLSGLLQSRLLQFDVTRAGGLLL